MDDKALRAAVERTLLTHLAREGQLFVPVASSNRHIHLSRADADRLFGPGYVFQQLRNLVQPGQYACREQVVLVTPKGTLSLRVLGPCRKETQVEISLTEAIGLGLEPVIRMSGDLAGTPGGTLQNGDRRIDIPRGIIVAACHMHLSLEQAQAYGLNDGDRVLLEVQGVRQVTFGNVVVRAGEGHTLEAHLDRDETNAAALSAGALGRISRQREAQMPPPLDQPSPPLALQPSAPKNPQSKKASRPLVTEEAVRAAHKQGEVSLLLEPGAIVTPLARDAALQYRIKLLRKGESAL